MSLPKFVVKQPVMVNMLMVVVFIAGIIALHEMPIEEHPSVRIEIAVVSATYPGASPEDVERMITLPLEDRIKTLPDIEELYATSYEGRCLIFIEYDANIDNYDIAVTDLKSEIDRVKPELPDDAADSLEVMKIRSGETWPIMNVNLGGEYGAQGIKELAESMKDELLNIDGIAKVDIRGTRTREIWVEADRARLSAYGVSLDKLFSAVQTANTDLPAGRIELGNKEFIVSPVGDLTGVEDIAAVVVRSDSDGTTVRVGDVAEVHDTFTRDEIISRLNARRSVSVRIYMKDEGSIIDIARQAKQLVEEYQANITDITFSVEKDDSIDVINSVRALVGNAIVGLLLVSFLMTFLIGKRSAALAVIGIPFAFMTAFVLLNGIGETINTLSLFAFILVLGIVVDDAIIVIENVYRHLEMGKSPVQAAIDGTHEVMWPVVSAVLTTVAAFLPLIMMEGRIGKFIYVLPIVAMLALLGSLVESLVVLPSHLADFGQLPKNQDKRLGDRMFKKLLATYQALIGKALRHRYLVVLGTFILTVVITFAALSFLRVEIFPRQDSSSEELIIRLPTGTKLEETDRVLTDLSQAIIDELPETDIQSVTSLSGMIVQRRSRLQTTDGGNITINLLDDHRPNEEIKADIRKIIERIPEIKTASFSTTAHGPPVGSPVDIRVRGKNLETMNKIAKMIMDDLEAMPGVSDVESDFNTGKTKIRFHPDRVKMSTYGITMSQLASILRTAIEGTEATSFRDATDDEVKVLVMVREDDRRSLDDLRLLTINTTTGISVPLSELGEFTSEETLETVQRYDAKRVIGVSANVDRENITSDEANKAIQEKYSDISARFPGYSLEFGGEAAHQKKAFGNLAQEFLIALILIYMILGSQFKSFLQPLVVMFTVPFSLLGVSVGLIVMGLNFSLVAGISVVALAGVVVNDSLVLVDFANVMRRKGVAINEAVSQAGAQRMRPILMTTFTTIAGLLPMAFGIGGAGLMWQPMAICMIWGLAFATFLTLFVIPCTYSLLEDWSLRIRTRLFKRD